MDCKIPPKVLSLQFFSHLNLLLTVLLQTDCLHADEARGIARLEAAQLVHGTLAHVVQLLGGRAAAQDDKATLVYPAADGAVDSRLRRDDRVLEELTLGGE